MKIKEIAKKLGLKEDKAKLFSGDDEIMHLLTDSRNCFNPSGTLFFAIRTPGGNDGHNYISELYEKGVRNFVVEYIPEDFKHYESANFLLTDDTVAALTEIGKLHRGNAGEIVAITGSRGKTTLKETIFQLMEPFKKISRSPRSYNSRIGVPLSLWQISPGSDIALIEAGISQKGEMERLAATINPDTVILTNLGMAHANGFSSQKEKAAEKALLAYAPDVKNVIYSADDEYWPDALANLPKDKTRLRYSFKNPEAELFLKILEEGKESLLEYTWKGEKHRLTLKTEKDYDIGNMAGALAFLLKEGISPEEIKERFLKFSRINTRLNVADGINGCSIILDSYTSDLSSLLPAIDFMRRRKMPSQSLTLIISDLRHEGVVLSETYREISKIVRDNSIGRFIGVGKSLKAHSSMFPEDSQFFENTGELLENISASDFNDEIILIKGAPGYDFYKISNLLEARKHETVLEVNLDAMLRNYNYFRSKVPSSTGIIAMVKASGYGAGSYEIAKTLQDTGASYLAVAALDEGVDLRNSGITMPIMVMNPKAANYRALFKFRLQPVVYSMSMLVSLIEEASKSGIGEYPIHIKLDTGMHRMGFQEGQLPELKALLLKAHNVKVASVFSHLATADCLDMDEFTLLQLQRFERMSSSLISVLDYPVKRHILNSAGILRFPEYAYDLVRLGIGLYGANTLPPEIEKPLAVVSSLRSVIICIREIEGDEAVGYGRKGLISGKSKIATIPIGYADGMNRHFGNGAIKVLVNGHPATTIGNICMDATMLDVTGIDCKEGDAVEIFGENLPLETLADTLGTIPYEILTSISPRVKRIYYRE